MTGRPNFAPLLEGFFTQRLMRQRRASAHTIGSYRDTFRLLLQFVQQRLRKAPSALMLDDIDAPLVVAFLDDLEAKRGITARTRNLRLTAIHSFFRYVAFEAPAHAAQTQRVLAIPAKRFTRTLVPFLSRPEVDALLAAPDLRTWSGRRDHAMSLLAVQTGLRLSELTGLVPDDLHLGAGAHVRVIGKGRKERCTPLSKSTRAVLSAWIREPAKIAGQPVFPGQACSDCGHGMPVVEAQARESTRAAAHDGDGPAARGRGSISDRAVAWSRVDRYDSDVPGRRPRIEAARSRPHDAADRPAGPVPA
jgi:site-specific recombinase XerD